MDDHLGVFSCLDGLLKPTVDALEIECLDDAILPVLFNLLVLQPARFDQWQRDNPGYLADLRSFCGAALRARRAGGDFASLCHDQTARGGRHTALYPGVDAFSTSLADHALAVDHGWAAVCQCSFVFARLAAAEFARSAALFELQPAWDAGRRLCYLVTGKRENFRLGVCGLLILLLFVEWSFARNKEFRWFLWTGSLTLVASQWIGIQTDPGNFIVLFLPMVLTWAVFEEHWGRRGRPVIWLVMVITFAGLWALFLRTVNYAEQPLQNPIMFFPLPLFLLVVLYWVRWWAIRPVRLLIDDLRDYEE